MSMLLKRKDDGCINQNGGCYSKKRLSLNGFITINVAVSLAYALCFHYKDTI